MNSITCLDHFVLERLLKGVKCKEDMWGGVKIRVKQPSHLPTTSNIHLFLTVSYNSNF